MKNNQIKAGAILSYIVVALNIIVGLLYTPFLIRCLGQTEYGLYSLVYSIISYLTILDMGLGNAIIIYTARYKNKNDTSSQNKLFGMFFAINFIIAIIASLIGVFLYYNIGIIFTDTMSNAELYKAKVMMLILIVNLAFSFPLGIFGNILVAYEKFVINKIIKIINIILQPFIMIPLLLLGFKSITMVLMITVINLFCLFLNTFYCFKFLKIKLVFCCFDKKLLKEIFKYSFYIFLAEIINKVNFSLDQFILGAVSGTAAVAIYSVASQVNSLFMAFSTAISGVMLPKITKMESSNMSNNEFTKIFIKTGRIQLFVILLILTGFILFGKKFIDIWAGPNYYQSYYIACILMIPMVIPLIQNIGLSILQAKNKYKYRTLILFGIAIINIIISIPLAINYSGIGSAIGTAISLIIGQGIMLNIYYHKAIHLDIIRFWKSILNMAYPILILFAIFYIFIRLFPINNLMIYILMVLIYIILYFIVSWKFSLNIYEKEQISLLLKKIKIFHK